MSNLISKENGLSIGELHLIVLWENARSKEQEILSDIKKNLQILECYSIAWKKQNVELNFARFYGVKLDNIHTKVKECGKESFLLCTVWDHSPDYQYVETSRGVEEVNIKLFGLKEKYRKWTGGGSKIHATNSQKKTNHDITLLLGKNYEDYLKDAPKSWDGVFKKLNSDVIGTNGWNSMEELFYVLNNTTEYAVLRNHECLPKQFSTKEHGDIDILAKDYSNTLLLLNASPATKLSYRVHCKNKVKGEEVFWDIRHIGDDYYCKSWQIDMLSSRVLNKNNIFTLDSENYFYSLIYHALIHKNKIASDYYEKVSTLYKLIYTNKKNISEKYPFDIYYQILKKFMYDKHYIFIRPQDKTVYYNENLINSDDVISYLENNYNMTNIVPFMINNYGDSGYTYFTGNYEGHKLFIKWGGLENSCQNEYIFTKKLYELNKDGFLKPWFYKCYKKEKFFAQDYIEGKTLNYLKENNLLSIEQKESIINQLQIIAETLLEAKVVHRDIRPENFILTSDNKLKLIDMQFTVAAKNYKERKFFRKYHQLISELGAEYALGKFMWDDFYSLTKLVDYIGVTESTKEIQRSLAKKQGKQMVAFSKYLRMKIMLKKILAICCPTKSQRKKLRGYYTHK